MERQLPPQYSGWQSHTPTLRRMTTAELIAEIQDGPPERRLAALSVIDLRAVPLTTIEDWIRTLPGTEANELAGAIPVKRPHSECAEELRWAQVARLGYERRRLATFLVVLFNALESVEARDCAEAGIAWEEAADWLAAVYGRLAAAADAEGLADISLFVFENYLDRQAIFEAFCGLLSRNRALATAVSADPRFLLARLPDAQQRAALRDAEEGGGLPFRLSWGVLHGL